MLSWCSYCQTFQGEIEPYHQLDMSHGICPECLPGVNAIEDADFEHLRVLQDIQSRLMAVGRSGDVAAADEIVRAAESAGVRPIDTLVGLVAPLLHQIGEEWERADISVAQEHRFTTFCEGLYELVDAGAERAVCDESGRSDVLLMNAAGNRHTLGIRFLALWLKGEGCRARDVLPGPGLPTLEAMIESARPRVLVVSMALAEQRESVGQVAARVAALPHARRPRILVGGYAVKMGMVSPIPGAELASDLRSVLAAVRG